MTGKTISLSDMTVRAVVGEDGIGQAADLAQHATQGQPAVLVMAQGLSIKTACLMLLSQLVLLR